MKTKNKKKTANDVDKYTLGNGMVVTSSMSKELTQTITIYCTSSSYGKIRLLSNILDRIDRRFDSIVFNTEAWILKFVVNGSISSPEIVCPTSTEECKLTRIDINASKASIERLEVEEIYSDDAE
jgi:hypothetical protein